MAGRFDAPGGLTDFDGACYLVNGACSGYSFDFGGSDIRLGRLRIGNASGSELQSLSLPVRLETWQNIAGGSFQLETGDTCTLLGAATLDRHNGNLGVGETTPTTGQLAAGRWNISLSAPGVGNDGSVQASFPTASTWLRYPWDGVSRTEARGLASFGTYKGATPLIFRRELYR
jgi:MSHA biogenesis protein MshQ